MLYLNLEFNFQKVGGNLDSVFLLGAGASVDAGVADAFAMTEKIHEILSASNDKTPAKVFGIVLAKIIAKRVRSGGSPFGQVNVEEVYDVLQRIAAKDTDSLGDFVTSWDPILSEFENPVRERDVQNAFESLINSLQVDRWSRHGQLAIGMGGVRGIVELLRKVTSRSNVSDLSNVEKSLLRALVQCLQHNSEKIKYIEDILSIIKENNGDIVTLNYDLAVEKAAENIGFSYDYGLDKWNSEKIVKFKRSSPIGLRVVKLHGSLNWFSNGDDITVRDRGDKEWILPNLVFGGASGKLKIDGPFLQLRHEFQTRLLACNNLVVIGYSFQDEHLNSIIRRWSSTRRNAKLIVVDPAGTGRFAAKIGLPYTKGEDGKIGKPTVDLNHIKLGAAASIEKLRVLLTSPISVEREQRNGSLPLIHFNVHQ